MTHWGVRWFLTGSVTVWLVLPAQAMAQTWWNPERVYAVQVYISDAVSDGCWPRPQATKKAVELVFRSAGILVVSDDKEIAMLSVKEAQGLTADGKIPEDAQFIYPHHFDLVGVGFEPQTSGGRSFGCTVALLSQLWRPETLTSYEQAGRVVYGDPVRVLAGPKANMQGHITAIFTEAATSLANDILKARAQ